jgi:hypothetical protein
MRWKFSSFSKLRKAMACWLHAANPVMRMGKMKITKNIMERIFLLSREFI